MNKLKVINYLLTAFFVLLAGWLLYLFSQQSFKKLIVYVLLSVINLGIVTLIRKVVNKKRPEKNLLDKQKQGEAWPSRHSYSAFYVIFSSWFMFPTWLSVFLFFPAISLAILRVKSKVHDYRDILSGMSLGIISGILVAYIVQKLF
ncbi:MULTISPECIES: phosphatase PAP2 family protein [Terrabacteria group]|uniref:phosphatase PAP2 family protein n=1 Tax=Bacillati TaxID=1783272 RepID=UPI001C6E4994|nr:MULTISPECIES: phosphatase PAP2 family protein [Terrabacteria group]MBW9212077.1 phosphatase PAP2 family protein [Trueperella sp. zg.1013]